MSSRLVRARQGVRFLKDGSLAAFNTATDLYNFAPDNFLQVPLERWNVSALFSAELGPATMEFAQKLADEIKPGTTVMVTDDPVVRNPIPDSTYFAAN